MKLDNQQKEIVIEDFKKLESLNDFVDFINKLDLTLYPTHSKPVEIRTLNFYLYHKQDKYLTFQIPKKSGGYRIIKSPDNFLKSIQRKINLCLNLIFSPKSAANGFVKERNIVTNAQKHVGKRYVLNLDLKDFFTSIQFGRVQTVLKLEPFNLNDKIANIIANLCCDEGVLPQGAPTSPTITNIVCQRLDRKLVRLAKENRLHYTRYADDLSFSSNQNVFNESLINQIKEIIKEEGFEINDKKQRLQNASMRQEVTGLVVNKKVNIKRAYIKKIRAILYAWETKGYEETKNEFQQKYKNEKGYLKSQTPDFELVILGRIQFIGLVRGKEDENYLKFIEKFKELIIRQEEPLSYADIMNNLKAQREYLFSKIAL